MTPTRQEALARKTPPATPEQSKGYIQLASEIDVLTAVGGELRVTSKQRERVAVFGNGICLVDRETPLGTEVLEVRAALTRFGIVVKDYIPVEIGVIRMVHEAADKRSGKQVRQGGEIQSMQKQFLMLVKECASRRGSDIHIIVEKSEAKVRFRVDGVITHIREMTSSIAQDVLSAAFNMADASDPTYRILDFQGARVSSVRSPLPEGVQSLRLQFNPLPNGGRYMVCRLLYDTSAKDEGGDVDSLGYSKAHIEDIRKMREKPFGLNVICGPTGSGKSTTLQRALLSLLREKRNTINVITIEDPPEFVIVGAQQFPITSASSEEERVAKFRLASNASLRSDPDVVMIGEIRDEASAALAFAEAMTGHQVWASLHANDAASILDRFRDQKVEMYKISDHTLVTGLIGQRLVRRLCDDCKIPFHTAAAEGVITTDVIDSVTSSVGVERAGSVYIANHKGCPKCREGRNGREVIAECIRPDAAFMKFIKMDDKEGAVRYWLDTLGGLTILEHGAQKMVKGMCDPSDLVSKAGSLSHLRDDRLEKVFNEMMD